jgi:sterol O-acyltransferase
MMKMHSYMAHNGLLSAIYSRLQKEKRTLSDYLETLPGGREAAFSEAATRQIALEAIEDSASQVSVPPSAEATPMITVTDDEGIATLDQKLTDLETNPTLRNRKAHKRSVLPATDNLPPPAKDLPKGTSLEPSHTTSPHEPSNPTQLSWSSDPRIAMLARNIDAMEDELRSNGKHGVVWPENITYKNFVEFLLFPTLVYQLEYPRTNIRRPLYILEKVLATFGTFSLIYTVTEHYIMPYTPKPGDSLVRAFVQLALPMMINFLL